MCSQMAFQEEGLLCCLFAVIRSSSFITANLWFEHHVSSCGGSQGMEAGFRVCEGFGREKRMSGNKMR